MLIHKASSVVSVCLAGYYIVMIVGHMLYPGANYAYTRGLLVLLPLVPVLAFSCALIVVMRSGVLGARLALPVVIFLATLSSAFIFTYLGSYGFVWIVAYLAPLIYRYLAESTLGLLCEIKMMITVYFISLLGGLFLVFVLEKLSISFTSQQDHFLVILPHEMRAAAFFFGVCLFALLNQLIAVWHLGHSLIAAPRD